MVVAVFTSQMLMYPKESPVAITPYCGKGTIVQTCVSCVVEDSDDPPRRSRCPSLKLGFRDALCTAIFVSQAPVEMLHLRMIELAVPPKIH